MHHLFDPLVIQAAELGAGLDWKTSLQEFAADSELGAPSYRVTESGPDHDKRFEAVAIVGNRAYAPGTGTSKKQAEQGAAQNAFTSLADSPGLMPELPEVEVVRSGLAGDPAGPERSRA